MYWRRECLDTAHTRQYNFKEFVRNDNRMGVRKFWLLSHLIPAQAHQGRHPYKQPRIIHLGDSGHFPLWHFPPVFGAASNARCLVPHSFGGDAFSDLKLHNRSIHAVSLHSWQQIRGEPSLQRCLPGKHTTFPDKLAGDKLRGVQPLREECDLPRAVHSGAEAGEYIVVLLHHHHINSSYNNLNHQRRLSEESRVARELQEKQSRMKEHHHD